ncbi:PTS sugar transporter subunit IIA [Paenibacillus daejeonensis]|uniref:PTS sugar transporter subunit IIA n=1 Tax=Paenibacillus daejeonensis TaxID=135193 RepID=UPI0004776AC7|nr:PTS glucose transporter subunit IIA [Paenibacillus daejeonensis]
MNKRGLTQRHPSIAVAAPVAGRLFPLSEVSDQNFSRGYLGEGVAIEPSDDLVVAPFAGTVSHIAETKHALLLKHACGLQLLIHIGIDTIDLQGEGFDMLVRVNDQVGARQPLVTFDHALIRESGYPACVIFIAIGTAPHIASIACSYREVQLGEQDAFRIMLKHTT